MIRLTMLTLTYLLIDDGEVITRTTQISRRSQTAQLRETALLTAIVADIGDVTPIRLEEQNLNGLGVAMLAADPVTVTRRFNLTATRLARRLGADTGVLGPLAVCGIDGQQLAALSRSQQRRVRAVALAEPGSGGGTPLGGILMPLPSAGAT